jgi:hypothetical protein
MYCTISLKKKCLEKVLSGIDLPQSKENIIKYVEKNRVLITKDMHQDILEIFKRTPSKKKIIEIWQI